MGPMATTCFFQAKPKPKSFSEPRVTVTKEDLEEPESDQNFRLENLNNHGGFWCFTQFWCHFVTHKIRRLRNGHDKLHEFYQFYHTSFGGWIIIRLITWLQSNKPTSISWIKTCLCLYCMHWYACLGWPGKNFWGKPKRLMPRWWPSCLSLATILLVFFPKCLDIKLQHRKSQEAYTTMMLFFLRGTLATWKSDKKLAKESTKCITVLMFPDRTRPSPFNIEFLHFSTGHVTEGRVPFLPPLENLRQERRAGASFIECFGEMKCNQLHQHPHFMLTREEEFAVAEKLGEAVVGV